MAEVAFNAVDKIYGEDVHAVQDLTLDIADGEFLVLVGPSGCGKTTALRMVAGLEEISGGTISIGGRVVNQLTSEGAGHRDGVPELRALPAPERRREHRLRAAAAQDAQAA